MVLNLEQAIISDWVRSIGTINFLGYVGESSKYLLSNNWYACNDFGLFYKLGLYR